MANMNNRITWCGLVAFSALPLAACSFSTGTTPAGTAETLIEGVLGEQAGMTFTGADCEAPADGNVGTPFECRAVNSDGGVIMFDAVIDPDDMIFVAPSNLVYAEEMSLVEEEAAEILGPQVGVVIDSADVDCPDETTVLDSDEMRCEITDAASGDRYELTVTFGDFILREGYADRVYTIADQPL